MSLQNELWSRCLHDDIAFTMTVDTDTSSAQTSPVSPVQGSSSLHYVEIKASGARSRHHSDERGMPPLQSREGQRLRILIGRAASDGA